MKIYKFFKIPNLDDDNVDVEQKYVLYAITNKKKYAERFQEDRNMDKFIFKVDEDVSEEEYAEICNNDNNRSSILELYPLTTIFNNKHTSKNKVQKKVLMTYWERQMIEEPNTILDDERFWLSMPFPLIFKKKYVELLNVLQYTTYYKLMTIEFLPEYLTRLLSENEDDDYSAPSIEFDEVRLFIDHISDTL